LSHVSVTVSVHSSGLTIWSTFAAFVTSACSFSMALPAHSGLWPLDSRNPWTSDQLIARPLPTQRKTQTQNKCIHTHTPNIHAVSRIRTHDLSVRASEDNSCLRLCGYCHRPAFNYDNLIRGKYKSQSVWCIIFYILSLVFLKVFPEFLWFI
jgi:hypothetical protein